MPLPLHQLSRRILTFSRSISTSTSTSTMTSSPFTRAVVSAIRQLYPPSLADTSFDNTGLLLESPLPTSSPRPRNSILLTIDLTRAVADEAIANRNSIVVAYHPVIFRGLKSLTLQNSQQQSLLRLAAAGISVYSPHTAVDAAPGGMCDWLCDIVTGKLDEPEPQAFTVEADEVVSSASATDVTTSESEAETDTRDKSKPNGDANTESNTVPALSDPFVTPRPTYHPKRPQPAHRTYSKPSYPSRTHFHPSSLPHIRKVITPCSSSALESANSTTNSSLHDATNTGYGRVITFDEAQPFTVLITRIAHAIGLPKGFPVAIPQGSSVEDISIRTVGVCPGSGGSVVSQAGNVDLVFTGEMSHHETLAITENGGCVICLFHSNTERGYLEAVMRERLLQKTEEEWKKMPKEVAKNGLGDERGGGRHRVKSSRDSVGGEVVKSIEGEEFDGNTSSDNDGGEVSVEVSQADRDPMGIVVLVESTIEGTEIRGA